MSLMGIFNIPIPSKVSGANILNTSEIIVFILISIILFIYAKFFHKNNIEYTICPTCKESFNYKDLKDGKCPYCEDVDTIEIEEYYKIHPEELEEKEKV